MQYTRTEWDSLLVNTVELRNPLPLNAHLQLYDFLQQTHFGSGMSPCELYSGNISEFWTYKGHFGPNSKNTRNYCF